MIDKILRILGLIRIRDINNVVYESSFDADYGREFPSDLLATVTDKLRKNQELREYLDWTIAQDVKRFYSATPKEQDLIRGAISRTRFIRSLCVEQGDKRLLTKRYI